MIENQQRKSSLRRDELLSERQIVKESLERESRERKIEQKRKAEVQRDLLSHFKVFSKQAVGDPTQHQYMRQMADVLKGQMKSRR